MKTYEELNDSFRSDQILSLDKTRAALAARVADLEAALDNMATALWLDASRCRSEQDLRDRLTSASYDIRAALAAKKG